MKSDTTMNPTTKPPLLVRVGLSTLLLLMGVGGVAMMNIAVRGVSEARVSGSWPTVAGKIVTSEMEVDVSRKKTRNKSTDSPSFTAKIEYEFEVNGAQQRGSRIAAVQDMNANKLHVQKVLNKYPVDRVVTVSYKPDDPSVCVLEPGSWGGVGVFFGLGLVFTLFPLGLLIVLWKPRSASSSVGTSPAESKGKLWATVLLLVFMAIGCVPLWLGIQGVLEARASLSWPKAEGSITRSSVSVTTNRSRNDNNRERISRSYSASIEYEFQVEGATLRGSRVTAVSDQFGSEDYARAISDKYPLGAKVSVSYNPTDPNECVLEPGRWSGSGMMFVLAGGFILLPLGFLRAIWQSNAIERADPHFKTKEQRQRFGLEFRERFLEWEPGNIIHLHRDHLGIVAVIGGALIAGLILGLLFGLPPALWLFSGRGALFVAQVYAGVSLVLAIGGGIWLGLDSRRRDTLIDWNRGTVRLQVGWFANEYPLDELQELTLDVSKPTKASKTAGEVEKKSRARVFLNVGRKRYVLLETEFHPDAHSHTQRQLASVTEQLAGDLKVSWSQS